MTQQSIEQLMAVESRLNWSLAVAVVSLLCTLTWGTFLADKGPQWVGPALLLFQLASYIWFAISVGAAAKILQEARWGYVTWVVVAPFLALIPIPIVSTLIAVSPLSIKFLLGGRLTTRIRESVFED